MTSLIRPLDQLEKIIGERATTPSEKSYTTKLLKGGIVKIGQKIIEEAAEVVEAADEPGEEGRSHTLYEAADLIYHLMVMLRHKEIDLAEVEEELGRRFGMSGLEEKAARPK